MQLLSVSLVPFSPASHVFSARHLIAWRHYRQLSCLVAAKNVCSVVSTVGIVDDAVLLSNVPPSPL
jgi:hypothetical protein